MINEDDDYLNVPIGVNPAQYTFLLMKAKNKYGIFSRGTGKSFIVGAEVDENVRLMPRGITTISQSTYGQALTKTLPSTFKMLEMLGYRRYDTKSKTGDYVVCRTPPDGWLRPYEHIHNFEHIISFSNGHALYILSQDGNSRGPNADYNITDEALTLDKEQFDKEVAPINRGNEQVFGRLTSHPLWKHHGNTFMSSMPYEPQQKWLLEAANYYEEERGIHLFDVWNKCVMLQMNLIEAKLENDMLLFKEIWNEVVRLRRTIQPFVSKDGTLFMLASIFDNIQNVGLSYIMNQYKVMDKLSFMIEILNYIVDKIDDCYYNLGAQNKYYNAFNNSFIRDKAENSDFNWDEMAEPDSRQDADCVPTQPLRVCVDYGSKACFMEIAQVGHYDFVTNTTFPNRIVDNTINEIYVKRNEESDTMVNAMVDRFCYYYRFHLNKTIIFFRDRYGDARRANSSKTYNETLIDRFRKNGWEVEVRVHRGMEPPQHEKFLLWANITAEKDERYPLKRFNATRCKHILISMNNTRVRQVNGRFEKDKRSERNDSILPEDATHFGDVIDKRVWTEYSHLQQKQYAFVDARV